MTITYELDLNSFKAWSGAIDTLDRIKREGKCEELESILEDTYPDGMTETELNDLLWFEADEVYSWVGLRTESEIQGEIDETEEELESLQNDFKSDTVDMDEYEAAEVYESDYKDDIEELKDRIDELRSELDEL